MKLVLLVAAFALTLVGCGGGSADSSAAFDAYLEELMNEPYTADQAK